MRLRQTISISVTIAAILLGPSLACHAGTYSVSAHGNSVTGVDRSHLDARYSTYATGNCAHCHEQHGSLGGAEPSPVDGGPSDYLLFSAVSSNALCNGCHDGSTGADNISTLLTKTYNHAASEARCIDCHESHTAKKPSHSEAVDGNAVTGGPLLGIDGVDAVWVPPGNPPADTESLSSPILTATAQIDKEYELCLKCHSTFGGGPPVGLTDQGAEFNPDNFSHHPVTGSGLWKNNTIRANLNLLKAPWNTNRDARMYCSDCHGSDTGTDPKGPHGSNKKYLLKAWGGRNSTSSYPNAAKAPDLLCLRCHIDGYGDGSGLSGIAPWDHKSNGNHRYTGEGILENELGCYACHGGPAGYADFNDGSITPAPQATSNGGRAGGIHGSNFYWNNPTGYADNPADHFLTGGYNVGIYLNDYDGGSDGDGSCWSYGLGNAQGDPCGSMKSGKAW